MLVRDGRSCAAGLWPQWEIRPPLRMVERRAWATRRGTTAPLLGHMRRVFVSTCGRVVAYLAWLSRSTSVDLAFALCLARGRGRMLKQRG
jgi:hypothetical protein